MTKLLDWIGRRLALWIVGSTLLTIASMWFISAAYRAPDGEEQPKVTDWMQAWGSIFGVVAGLGAAGAAAALFVHEQRRSEKAERQLAEERADAALSVPRSVTLTPAGFGGHGHVGNQFISNAAIGIYNHGENAIRDVVIIAALPDDGPQILLATIPFIGPRQEHRIREDVRPPVAVPPGPWQLPTIPATITVCFVDHTNQAWQKTSNGEISRTTVPYPAVEAARPSDGTTTP
ncbi:hypothetical protein [Micromonospora aurantiaca (nom. illeg.)]|uniref:hypothetical protein n=1 Tax=Micromonospora aurantiaca (nom. illeg.) TaxID=47850 RepID=UPI0016572DDD|nr:hypothetical protein [Micromonospora aurantiaca]MBC9005078.1 hypothetical protein [Micromonospora aurantiaca]